MAAAQSGETLPEKPENDERQGNEQQGIVRESRTQPPVQQFVHQPLAAAQRAIPSREPMKRTYDITVFAARQRQPAHGTGRQKNKYNTVSILHGYVLHELRFSCDGKDTALFPENLVFRSLLIPYPKKNTAKDDRTACPIK